MGNCCICNEIVPDDSANLCELVKEPVCGECRSKLNEVRFGSQKEAALEFLEFKMEGNPSLKDAVSDYMRNNIGVTIEGKVKQTFLTSGFGFEGFRIVRYLGMTSGDYALGLGVAYSVGAAASDVTGSGSSLYAEDFKLAKDKARDELAKSAAKLGANAVIGVDYDVFSMKGLLGFSANGTAVIVERAEGE